MFRQLQTIIAAVPMSSHHFDFLPVTRIFYSSPVTGNVLSIELLLIGLHVHATLQLGAGGADLESHGTVRDALVKLLEAGHTAVLHGVLQTRSQIRDEFVDGTGREVSMHCSNGPGREGV